MPDTPEIKQQQDYWIGRFTAMACPCEILISTTDSSIASDAIQMAYQEAKRIEHKLSRYRDDNIIYQINHANGETITLDDETALMMDFADQCFQLSDGKFDITSGVLRETWTFDGSNNIPDNISVNQLLPRIGWNKVNWQKPSLTLEKSMEIDLGGIGKEYAVDQTARLIHETYHLPVLVNFGGDIFATAPRNKDTPWLIGVDDPDHTGEKPMGQIQLYQGGLATSGDARRFLLKDGIRYSHILDPTTGWPVPDAPRSVTVIANSCLEAGMLSTFAMLQGKQAKEFLEVQGVQYWCAKRVLSRKSYVEGLTAYDLRLTTFNYFK